MLPSAVKHHLSGEVLRNVHFWLAHYPEFKEDIVNLVKKKDWEELEDAFYTHIEIGTGGIRGKMGVGPNRINFRIIGEAAQGLSQFIKDFGKEAVKKGVVVGYEARKLSKEFAQLSCQVFAANGIKSYLFDNLRATPEISFAVRHLKATAGVQITASHNPRTDNGFKFYWSDGGQVVPPLDLKFMDLVTKVTEIKKIDFEEVKREGMITLIGSGIDKPYLQCIKSLSLGESTSAKIVFSPIHGAGSTNVLPVLKERGFDVTVVPKQIKPDENFPTAKGDLINPEYEEVMELPIKLAQKIGADLAINSDPDADRVGIAVKKSFKSDKVQFLSGNEVGAALTYFILSRLKEKSVLRPGSLVIETYVTTTLIRDIAKSFGIRIVDDLLVGFKFIAQTIEKLKDKSDFVFAAEESLGYLSGTFTRDKDAAIASLLFAQMTSWLKDREKTVVEYLDEIYMKYGYYKNILHYVEMAGKDGFVSKKKTMEYLRAHPPSKLAGLKVIRIIDRLPKEMAKPEVYKVGMTGDQITFILSKDERTRVTIRPSGTEPKLKYYIQHFKRGFGDLRRIKNEVNAVAKELGQSILTYCSIRKELVRTI